MINAATARRTTEEIRRACKDNPAAYEQRMESVFKAISQAAKSGHSGTQFTFSSDDYNLICFDEYAQERLAELGYSTRTSGDTISIYW